MASDIPDLPVETTVEEDEEGSEPIELLVQLAKDGEIDPWDIDIVTVTEEFLAALDAGDLRASGRALFYASVLLRMKSDSLLESDEPEDDQVPEEQPELRMDDPFPEDDPIASLEAEMDRRLDRKRARGSPETLDDLIRELRDAERNSWWKESREYDTSGSSGRQGTRTLSYEAADAARPEDQPTATAVSEQAHTEDIEEIIDTVYETVKRQYEAGRQEVLFEEIADAGGSRVQTFLAGLFLANRGKITLRQDELFGDLWFRDPAAGPVSSGATADCD